MLDETIVSAGDRQVRLEFLGGLFNQAKKKKKEKQVELEEEKKMAANLPVVPQQALTDVREETFSEDDDDENDGDVLEIRRPAKAPKKIRPRSPGLSTLLPSSTSLKAPAAPLSPPPPAPPQPHSPPSQPPPTPPSPRSPQPPPVGSLAITASPWPTVAPPSMPSPSPSPSLSLPFVSIVFSDEKDQQTSATPAVVVPDAPAAAAADLSPHVVAAQGLRVGQIMSTCGVVGSVVLTASALSAVGTSATLLVLLLILVVSLTVMLMIFWLNEPKIRMAQNHVHATPPAAGLTLMECQALSHCFTRLVSMSVAMLMAQMAGLFLTLTVIVFRLRDANVFNPCLDQGPDGITSSFRYLTPGGKAIFILVILNFVGSACALGKMIKHLHVLSVHYLQLGYSFSR